MLQVNLAYSISVVPAQLWLGLRWIWPHETSDQAIHGGFGLARAAALV
jgi:hypothetical protein